MMGISVISTLNVAPSASVAQAASIAATDSATGGLTGGFAALLTGQIGNLLGLTGNTTSPIPGGEKPALSSAESDAEQGVVDPGIALLAAPVIPTSTIKFDPAIAGSSERLADATASPGKLLLGTETGLAQGKAAGSSVPPPGALAEQLEGAISAMKGKASPGEAAILAAETPASQTVTENPQLIGNTLGNNAAIQAHAQQSVQPEVRTPLGANNWAHDFSEKIVWLAKNDQQSAQININPPNLGPVQITLQINGDQANASFASPHPEVRQAIENSMAQLRDALSTAGINLGQTDIGANLAQQNRDTPFQQANGKHATGENAILVGIGKTTDTTVNTPIQRGRGLVDLFA